MRKCYSSTLFFYYVVSENAVEPRWRLLQTRMLKQSNLTVYIGFLARRELKKINQFRNPVK